MGRTSWKGRTRGSSLLTDGVGVASEPGPADLWEGPSGYSAVTLP